MSRRLDLQHLLPMPLGRVSTTEASRVAMGGEFAYRDDFERVTLRQTWGNWGEMTAAETVAMDESLAAGGLIMGRHTVTAGVVLVVTYPDRKSTLVCTPEELTP